MRVGPTRVVGSAATIRFESVTEDQQLYEITMTVYPTHIKEFIQTLFESIAAQHGNTVSLGLQLTTKCMNDCSYCGADRHDRVTEIDFDLLKSHIIRYKEYATKMQKEFLVGLDGADNFLYSHFDELIQWLFDNNIAYFAKCNASTLTEARATRLLETKCKYVRLTVCGTSDKHNALRGLDTYDIVVKKTKMAADKGLAVIWNLTVGADNLASIFQVLKDIPSMQLSGLMENRIYKAGNANQSTYAELQPLEWRRFLQTMLNNWIAVGDEKFPLQFRDSLWVPFLVEEGLLDISNFANNENSFGCGLDAHYACIAVDGHIKGCLTLEAAAKEVNSQQHIIKFVPNDNSTLFFTKDIKYEYSHCKRCEYYRFCRGCAAVTLANTGNINNQDPQCWVGRKNEN